MSTQPPAAPIVPASVIYCGDCLEELQRLPDGCIDLVYLDPPFNSNRNYEVFWGDTRERRAFEDRYGDAQAGRIVRAHAHAWSCTCSRGVDEGGKGILQYERAVIISAAQGALSGESYSDG